MHVQFIDNHDTFKIFRFDFNRFVFFVKPENQVTDHGYDAFVSRCQSVKRTGLESVSVFFFDVIDFLFLSVHDDIRTVGQEPQEDFFYSLEFRVIVQVP